MKINLENSLKKALSEGINLFLGSGFSTLARNSNGQTLPLGRELAHDLCKEFDCPHYENLPLPQLCTILEAGERIKFISYLKHRFSVKEFSSKYNAIVGLPIKNIFTTNIDDLIYKIYETNDQKYINDVTIRGPKIYDRNAIDYIPLHGCIYHENTKPVFSTTDIAGTFTSDPDRWNYLVDAIRRTPTVFLGYSMEDAGVLQALGKSINDDGEQANKWILVHNANPGSLAYYSALNFETIEGSTENLLDYFAQHLTTYRPDTNKQSARLTKALFPDNSVPEVTSITVRPVSEFYLGAEPTWSDIFLGKLYKTHHYAKIEDAINGTKPTIVIGLAACGKTTLLMQLAAGISFAGHKVVVNAPTPEQANNIIRKLGGEKAVIFVDNFADHAEVFDQLAQIKNIKLVCFDRDHHFEIVRHKIRSPHTTLDVTDLTNKDLQELYIKIPLNLRDNYFTKPNTEHGVAPSIYEAIEWYIRAPKIKDRFLGLLKHLCESNQTLHDLLIM